MLWLRNGLNPINLESSITTGCFGKCAIGHSGGTQPYSIEQQKLSLVSRLSRGKIFTRTRRTYVPLRDRQKKLDTILLKNHSRPQRPDTIFWACAEFAFRVSQSDLSDLTGNLWISDFRCLTSPKVANLGADQKECALWGRKCYENSKRLFKNYQESDWLS